MVHKQHIQKHGCQSKNHHEKREGHGIRKVVGLTDEGAAQAVEQFREMMTALSFFSAAFLDQVYGVPEAVGNRTLLFIRRRRVDRPKRAPAQEIEKL